VFELVIAASLAAVPCERHVDFSNWTGQFKGSYTVVITAHDGTKFDVVCDLAAGGTAAQACDSLWFVLEDAVALVFNNVKAEGWDVTMLPSGLAFSVPGWKTPNGQLDKLKKAGITYEGAPVGSQPRLSRNGVIGEIYKDGQWSEGTWQTPNP
jgi:hypothetical protein